MERLNCFLCNELANEGGLAGLRRHFINVHGITRNRAVGFDGYICGQNNCQENFLSYDSFSKHIRQNHIRNIANNNQQQNLQVNNPDLIENDQNINFEVENINLPETGEFQDFDSKEFVAKLVGNLHCHPSINGSIITTVLKEFEKLFNNYSTFIQRKMLFELQKRNSINNQEIEKISQAFKFENPFSRNSNNR